MSQREHIINPFQDREESQNRRQSKTRKRRRWPIFLLVLALLIAFLPNLIGLAGLHQMAVDYALSDFQGKVVIERASFGWLQPLTFTNVSAVDEQGNELLQVERVSTSKSLLSFLNSKDLGVLNIENPTLYLHLRPDGSNLEDAVSKYLTPQMANPKPTPEPRNPIPTVPKITIRVNEGRALVTTSLDTQSWQIVGLNAVAMTGTETAPLTLEAECQITPTRVDPLGQLVLQNPGKLAISSQVDAGTANLSFGAIDLAISTADLPLSLAAPVLQRFVGPSQSAGQFSGGVRSRIDLRTQAINLELEDVNLTDLAFAAPQVLGTDRVVVQNLNAHGSLELSPSNITSSNFQVRSDFGKVNANGRFDISRIDQLANGNALLETPFQMDGQINLAGLFRMLPATLQLHQDLQIESGIVKFQAGTKTEKGIPRLIVNLDAANLKARRGAQDIVWQKPLRLVGTISRSQQGLVIDDVLCESEFLSVAGHANYQTGAFRARGDLAQLMDRIGQFVELQGTQMAGEIDGSFGWQTAESAPVGNGSLPIQIGGKFTVTNPAIQFANMPAWKQSRLLVSLSAAGRSRLDQQMGTSVIQLDQGGIQVDVGTERAVATLAAPLQNAASDPWNLNCHLTGDLNGWVRHLQSFVDLGDVRAAGQLDLTCGTSLRENQLHFSNLRYDVQQLNFEGYELKIRDPKVTGVAAAASYDMISGAFEIPNTTLTAESFAARGQNLRILVTDQILVDGMVAYRADVNRVADWLELSPTEESVFWFGNAEGSVEFSSAQQRLDAKVDMTIRDLVAAQRVKDPARQSNNTLPVSSKMRWQQVFREPETNIASVLSMASDFNAIQFNSLFVNSTALNMKASGSISELATRTLTDLKGTWNPDWNKINALLAAYTANVVQLAGSGEQPFSIRGPLFATTNGGVASSAWVPPELEASTIIRWDGGAIANVPLGASQFDINVRNGIGQLKTEGVAFSGGVLRMAPNLDLRTENPVLLMERTRVVDNVALSPETARQWLKYVAPLVAGTTSAQGTITLDTEVVRVPLLDPTRTEAQGSVQLTDVVIGAGPLAKQLLGAVEQLRAIIKPQSVGDTDSLTTWLQMAEQTVPFVVKDQRIFHQNVNLRHKELTIRTHGSVGFDQSLEMVAEIPIPDEWIAGKSLLAGLKGRKISIPISGTMSRPVLDLKAIRQLSTQMLKDAAGGVVNQAIGEKVTPKINDFQNQMNSKLTNELDRFQNKINKKIGGSLLPNGSNQPPAKGTSQQNIGNQLEDELRKGIGSLFGGGK